MANIATWSLFTAVLIIVPIFGRNIHQRNVNDYDRIVETNVNQILPSGMNISAYNNFVLSYWTPERMAAAKPMDLLKVTNSTKFSRINHSPLKTTRQDTPARVTIPGVSPKSVKAAPSVVGKLYFRLGSSNYVCSGSVIASENGDTLFTAGHCVFDPDTGAWVSDLVFVPAYLEGSSPYGSWVWRTAAAMRGWTQYGDFNYDVAIILAATSDTGEHIQDLTGSLGMTVNKERDAQTDAYGYPVNIHKGEQLASCSDQASAANIPQLPTYEGMRLPCNMTGGSSGGPWTQEDSYQTSVNSFGIVGEKDVMYGPYFGNNVLNLWEQYQRQ